MANKIECAPCGDGVEIVRLVSTDRNIVIPEEHDGMRVVSLGDRFMMGSPSVDSRTVTVPASVIRASPDAFSGTMGIKRIVYKGDFAVFNGFRLMAEYDCEVVSTFAGRDFSFPFQSGYHMSFPEFDEEILKVSFKLSDDVAIRRLRDPVFLTDECRSKYADRLRDRVMPIAEHAVTSNDPESLMSIVDTGLLRDDDLRSLLRRAVTSGKTAMTSTIMSVLYSRSKNQKD